MSKSFVMDVTMTPEAHRKMWKVYADFRITATRLDIRKMLWRLIALLVLNAVFFAVTKIVVFVWLILIAFPLFAIFMRLSYRRARKAKYGIEKWLEEETFVEKKFTYTVNDEEISWGKGKDKVSFDWKKCVYFHEEEGVLMVFDGKSKLLFLLSREVCGAGYAQLKDVVLSHTKEVLSKSII